MHGFSPRCKGLYNPDMGLTGKLSSPSRVEEVWSVDIVRFGRVGLALYWHKCKAAGWKAIA